MKVFALLLAFGLVQAKVEIPLSTDLVSHCYHIPAKDFSFDNNIKNTYGKSPHLLLDVGDTAVEFTLPTPEGKMITLSDLLDEKPVLLIWGHYTCPAFQGYNSDSMFPECSYSEENKMIEAYSDSISFVHLIGPEPHPMWPYTNFDSGNIRMNLWSIYTQPQSFDERMEKSVPPVQALINDSAILLVDYLDGSGGQYNNPVWCTYANGARAAILIGQDGVIAAAQTWFSRTEMEGYIDSYLSTVR